MAVFITSNWPKLEAFIYMLYRLFWATCQPYSNLAGDVLCTIYSESELAEKSRNAPTENVRDGSEVNALHIPSFHSFHSTRNL